jgi:small subunit ribosomal protein S8
MSMTDPIADFLTRVRNASTARHNKVDAPASKLIKELSRILVEEGYVRSYTIIENPKQDIVRLYLKYDQNQKNAISGLTRISRPGIRRYVDVEKIPRVLNGLGTAIISTPKGLLTDKKAKKERVGGEVICHVW